MVRQEGFEPPTAWFVAKYSIQLSYWRMIDETSLYGGAGEIRTLERFNPLPAFQASAFDHLCNHTIC